MAEPFRVITDEEIETPPSRQEAIGIEALRLGLGALAQRTIVALSRLFTLLTVASAFALWWNVLPSPSVLQLTGLGMYGLFILAANFLVRR